MERLTYFKDGYWRVNFSGVQYQADFVDRLAAYEDTGWTPEMLHKLGENAGHMWDFAQAAGSMTIGRLKELAEADKDGRVLILPCKVGDMAYWVHNGVITGCHVYRIQVNRKGTFVFLKSTISHGGFRTDACLGKTVFLSREEAEKALQKMEGKKDG